jgi:pimeloyl-ACP methyl ester carboxylesterase
MVGHSFGGLLSRLYASTYPDEVVGMVLVDPFTEAIRSALGTEHWETWRSTNGVVSEEYLAAHPETERFDINAAADSMERVLASQPLRDMPIFALTAGLTGEMSAEQIAALPPGYPDALSGALAASAEFLTNLLPAAKHLDVADSGHYIQAEKPNLVIDAVRQVVQAVREPATWSA